MNHGHHVDPLAAAHGVADDVHARAEPDLHRAAAQPVRKPLGRDEPTVGEVAGGPRRGGIEQPLSHPAPKPIAADQRRAELDRQIRQFEMLRKAWEASNAMMNMVRGAAPSGTTAAAGQQAGQSGAQQQAAQRPANTEANRIRSRKDMIDRTSPVQRAQFDEYRRAMEERRKQLGLKN